MEKKFNFKIGENEIVFVISEGNIIDIQSSTKQLGKKYLEKTLEAAIVANTDKYIRMHKLLYLNSKYYKISLELLKRRKKQVEEELAQITALLPKK